MSSPMKALQEEIHRVGAKAVVMGTGTCALICLGQRLLVAWRSRAQKKLLPEHPLLPTSGAANPEASGLDGGKLAEMASSFRRKYIDSGRMQGAVIAVVRRGEVVGVWEMGSYTTETVFKLYSVTKIFTALAGLQVCEKDGISMDTPVSTLVPEWPKDLWVERSGALTLAEETLCLRHCFTHTGGFSLNYGPACHPIGACRPAEGRRLLKTLSGFFGGPTDLKHMVSLEGQQPLIFTPGSHFDYGGVGTVLIARVVEESSGMSIAEYMQKRLLEPVGMHQTGFILDESLADQCVPTDAHPAMIPALGLMQPTTFGMLKLWLRGLWALLFGQKLVKAWRPAGVGVQGPKKLWDPSLKHFHPDAGLAGTGGDFVKWLQALTKKGTYSEAALRRLATPVTEELQAPFALDAPNVQGRLFPVHGDALPRTWRQRPFNNLPGQRYSLGACVITDPSKSNLPARAEGSWHWMGFASTYFFVNPKEELAACFLSQVVSHTSYPILEELLRDVHNSLQ